MNTQKVPEKMHSRVHWLLQPWTAWAPSRNTYLSPWPYCPTPCENSWNTNWDFRFQLLQRLTLWKGLAFSGPGPGLPWRLPKNLYLMEELKWRALKYRVERCNQNNLEIKGKDSQKCRVRCTLIYLEQVGTGCLLQDNNFLSPFENPCVFKMSGLGETL